MGNVCDKKYELRFVANSVLLGIDRVA